MFLLRTINVRQRTLPCSDLTPHYPVCHEVNEYSGRQLEDLVHTNILLKILCDLFTEKNFTRHISIR